MREPSLLSYWLFLLSTLHTTPHTNKRVEAELAIGCDICRGLWIKIIPRRCYLYGGHRRNSSVLSRVSFALVGPRFLLRQRSELWNSFIFFIAQDRTFREPSTIDYNSVQDTVIYWTHNKVHSYKSTITFLEYSWIEGYLKVILQSKMYSKQQLNGSSLNGHPVTQKTEGRNGQDDDGSPKGTRWVWQIYCTYYSVSYPFQLARSFAIQPKNLLSDNLFCVTEAT